MASVTPSPVPPPAPEVQPERLSFPARVIGVLFSPTDTFADIARRPAFIGPMILFVVLVAGFQVLVQQRIGTEQLVRQQVMQQQRVAQASPEVQERAVQQGMAFAKVSTFLVPVFSVAVFCIIAGLLLVIVNFVLGAEVKFKTMLTVACYASVPSILYLALAGATLFLKDPSDIDVQNMVASNLGILVDRGAHKALYKLASSMDLFSFWQIALYAIGITAATRFSFKKALAAVMVPWALWVLGAFAIASIF